MRPKAVKALTPDRVARFRREIYAHYRAHGRNDLPWRTTRNPYRILVSEFMLQQTQVSRVIERYGSFIRRFPDLDSLSRASLSDVLGEWSGLGYNRRALLLRETARSVVSSHGGSIPREADRLRALPGVGPATAAAVLAFAFGEPATLIETNIRAVFIQFFFNGRGRVADSQIAPLVEQTIDRRDPRAWYYALMDYGVMLKRTHPNPSRKSAHHAVQSKFAGSDREARGRIVRALARRGTRDTAARRVMDERALAAATGLSLARVRKVVPALARDGLVRIRGARVSIE